jgi:hypothetical protein
MAQRRLLAQERAADAQERYAENIAIQTQKQEAAAAAALAAAERRAARDTIPRPYLFSDRTGTDNATPMLWMQRVERYFHLAEIDTYAERLTAVAKLVANAAAEWHVGVTNAAPDHKDHAATWEDYKAMFLKRFLTVNPGAWARRKLGALKAANADRIDWYIAQFRGIMPIVEKDMAIRDKLFYFTEGLPAACRERFVDRDPADMDAAYQIAAVWAVAQASKANAGAAPDHNNGGANRFRKREGEELNRVEGTELCEDEPEPREQSLDARVMQMLGNLEKKLTERLDSRPPRRGDSNNSRHGGQRRDQNGRQPGSRQPNTRVQGLPGDLAHRRIVAGVCLRCNRNGHYARECRNGPDLLSEPNTTFGQAN